MDLSSLCSASDRQLRKHNAFPFYTGLEFSSGPREITPESEFQYAQASSRLISRDFSIHHPRDIFLSLVGQPGINQSHAMP